MKWINKGHIFTPDGEFNWSMQYAQVPTPIELENSIRIFYTTRPNPINGNFVSFTSYIDVDKNNPQHILSKHNEPILQLGEKGTFDEHGIMPGSLIKHNNALFLYYTGWSRELTVPYTTSIGLSISYDNGVTFTKLSNGPVMSKNTTDPFLINGPYVIIKDNLFHMWYSSCYKWIANGEKYDPVYKIKHATSPDGINWLPDNNFCIPESIENEAQNAPCILLLNGLYYMFFCFRKGIDFRNAGNGYRLCYATSSDLINWNRIDSQLYDFAYKYQWDSEMQAYPRVISINQRYYCFYNGNNFGQKGFGYSELKF